MYAICILQNLTKTCFATNCLIIERLLKMKPIVEQTFINPRWMTFVNTLCNTHGHKSFIKAKYVWTNIKKDKFLDTCANFVHIVKSILVTLKAFDDKQHCMEKHGLSWKHENMSYHYKINCFHHHWALQMQSNNNFTIDGRCWWSIYIMWKHFSIYIY
jgi:hypothetical protein